MRKESFLSGFLLSLLTIDVLLVTCSFLVTDSWAWSNGGYSSDPANPDYGTHDWIAEHALDWLRAEEKRYIVDNLAAYLYGTELPDNGGAPDGIGDTVNHHIYYNLSEVMTDDAAAVRAATEYSNALSFLEAKDYANAAKTAGIMSHYIVDVAVFGHVMGAGTDWGAEVHHSDYETYVNARTSSFVAEFDSYLLFDGSLQTISAYDAARDLAYDTTFDVDGLLNCTWMDQNYDWSDPVFKNRAGESLNLAVNYLTDVLHTLYQTSIPDEAYISVPHHSQVKNYYCGPAALEMVFDYYGPDVSQTEIADVARTASDGTYTTDMVRASHFSNLSTSVGAEMLGSITGYTARTFGYAALQHSETTMDELKSLIAAGYPIIVLTTWHFRVAVGYSSTHITFQDSWWGPMYNMTYGAFDDDWDYSGHWALLVTPWEIEVSTPANILQGGVFDVTASIGYPAPYPFYTNQYPASLSNATIVLPSGLNLAPGETFRKTIDTGVFASGDFATVEWALEAEEAGAHVIEVEAFGKVAGSVPSLPSYPEPYSYTDRIGEVSQTTIEVLPEEIPPITVDDYDGLWHTADFTIALTATDTISGVAETYYKLNDGPTKTVLVDGHPSITVEASNNKLEYWSVDNAGNEETHHILTEIKLDKTAPTGSIVVNNGATYATLNSATLTLTATDATSDVYQVRYSNDGVWDTESWETPLTTRTWTLPTGDGTKTVYYQIKDNVGLISTTYSDTIILDATPPTGSVAINEDASYTTTTAVTLAVTSEDETSGVAQMRFSHDEATWTPWEAYSTTKTWTLTTNDGTKTVYCQIKDNAGLVSLTYSDTITLDTALPAVSITNPTSGFETRLSTLTITWSGSDETSGISRYEVRLDSGSWSDVGTDTSFTLAGLAEGTHTFDVKAMDSAGHEKQSTITFVVNTSPLLGPGYLEEVGIAAALVVVVLGLIAYVMRKRRKK